MTKRTSHGDAPISASIECHSRSLRCGPFNRCRNEHLPERRGAPETCQLGSGQPDVLCEFTDVVKQAGGRRALLDAIEIHQDERKEHVKELQQYASDALKKLL